MLCMYVCVCTCVYARTCRAIVGSKVPDQVLGLYATMMMTSYKRPSRQKTKAEPEDKRQTDGQTDRQTDEQTGRQTDKQRDNVDDDATTMETKNTCTQKEEEAEAKQALLLRRQAVRGG